MYPLQVEVLHGNVSPIAESTMDMVFFDGFWRMEIRIKSRPCRQALRGACRSKDISRLGRAYEYTQDGAPGQKYVYRGLLLVFPRLLPFRQRWGAACGL